MGIVDKVGGACGDSDKVGGACEESGLRGRGMWEVDEDMRMKT